MREMAKDYGMTYGLGFGEDGTFYITSGMEFSLLAPCSYLPALRYRILLSHLRSSVLNVPLCMPKSSLLACSLWNPTMARDFHTA